MICSLFPIGIASAQATDTLTAEALIERAQQAYRPPGLRSNCRESSLDEIVVCAPDPDRFRVRPSSEDPPEIGAFVYDGVPSAAWLFKPPPCVPSFISLCVEVGADLPGPLLIDLAAIPEALTPEEAAMVFSAEEVGKPE
jgi:hypothetical protein